MIYFGWWNSVSGNVVCGGVSLKSPQTCVFLNPFICWLLHFLLKLRLSFFDLSNNWLIESKS